MLTVGIDIGTSYSSISILDREGKPQPVRVANGASIFGDSYSMPSAVYVEDNRDIVIGQLAMSARIKNPSSFQGEFKRDLGQKIPYHLGSLQLMPEDLYKEFLIYFKKAAEEAAGEKIKKAYITYPANFSKRKRELIEDAGKKAGLLEIEMIDEPTAAAYCYCSKGKIKVGDRLLVYDFGGGTFDVALIEYTNQGFKPLTQPLGIDKCGGIDIDMHIFNDIYNSIPADTIGMVKNNQMVINRLKAQIMEYSVKIKHQLSSSDTSKESIPLGYDFVEYQLTKEKLKEMIDPMVEETLLQVKAIVKNANLTMADISTCILVGGTSRIPYIRERLEEITGKPVYKDIDPELSVCMGAALWQLQQTIKTDGPDDNKIHEEKKGALAEAYEDKNQVINSATILKTSTELALEKLNQSNKKDVLIELHADKNKGNNSFTILKSSRDLALEKAIKQDTKIPGKQYHLGGADCREKKQSGTSTISINDEGARFVLHIYRKSGEGTIYHLFGAVSYLFNDPSTQFKNGYCFVLFSDKKVDVVGLEEENLFSYNLGNRYSISIEKIKSVKVSNWLLGVGREFNITTKDGNKFKLQVSKVAKGFKEQKSNIDRFEKLIESIGVKVD